MNGRFKRFQEAWFEFLFTPLAIVIGVTAVMCGWKPVTMLKQMELEKLGKNRFSYNGKEYLKTFGTYWELPNKQKK
jgi:hypothetical protein